MELSASESRDALLEVADAFAVNTDQFKVCIERLCEAADELLAAGNRLGASQTPRAGITKLPSIFGGPIKEENLGAEKEVGEIFRQSGSDLSNAAGELTNVAGEQESIIIKEKVAIQEQKKVAQISKEAANRHNEAATKLKNAAFTTDSVMRGVAAVFNNIARGGGNDIFGIVKAGLSVLAGGLSVFNKGGQVDQITGVEKNLADPATSFGKGGIVFHRPGLRLPPSSIPRLAGGGRIVGGPVNAIVGEEGDELVARMKPARSQDTNDETKFNIIIQGDILPREGVGLQPKDVVLVVADDMQRMGKTGKAAINVVKQAR